VRKVIRVTWETRAAEVRNLNARRWRAMRESDRRIVPSKPGNAGRGKAPDFWHAFEDGKDRVIGDEPETPLTIGSLPRKLCVKAKVGKAAQALARHRPLQRSECSTPLRQ
jgi:hypothetical protein